MIKHMLTILVSMILLITLGTIGLYKVLGTYSGQDAVCLSGLISGFAVGLWYGKSKGVKLIYAVSLCSVLLSVPLVILSLLLVHGNQDLVESLAFFSIGFALLSSYAAGLAWGKHLTNQSMSPSAGQP